MRIALALLLAAALPACGSKPADPGNAAKPAAVAATATPSDATALAQWREDSLRGCIGGARDRVGDPAVPVERHCACAVDREMAGKSMAELEEAERSGAHETLFPALLRQCIAEISPGYRPGGR
jgi:hypothetical protein